MSDESKADTGVFDVTAANELLKEYFGDDEEWRVDNHTLSGKDFIFTTADKKKIIKFVDFSSEIENGIKLHESYSKIGCNICKLLNYKITKDEKKIIIVMENCGQDLVDFVKSDISLMLLLQLSSELLKQIICLQNPPDGGAGVVHGDIKPENVTVQTNPDSSLNVRLIDFDGSDEIRKQQDGTFSVNLRAFTLWMDSAYAPDATSKSITTLVKSNVNVIAKFLKLKSKPNPKPLCNIPNSIGLQLLEDPESVLVGSLDYLHIIDLCSWSYTISLVFSLHDRTIRELDSGLFVYNILLVVVMNILLPNYNTPKETPVDCFGRVINKEYCDKVVNGLSALSTLLSDSYVPNTTYTHSKAQLFARLIQECSSSDELIRRFKAILQANTADYDEHFEITDDAKTDAKTNAKFEMVQKHIMDAVAAPAGAGGGGSIRITRRNIRKVRKMQKLRTLRKIRRTRKSRKRRTHYKKARM